MERTLFRDLRKEIERDYGITKKSIHFIPFEDWRKKLRTYPSDFQEEYQKNLLLLRTKLGLNNLEAVRNPGKKLILFVGVPGAGKTTLAKAVQDYIPKTVFLRGEDIVNALNLFGSKASIYRKRLKERGFTYPDPWYLSYIYQENLTRETLNLGYNVVSDDSIRTKTNRMGYYKLARESGAKFVFVQISAPFETYVKREEGRIDKRKINFLGNFVLQTEDIDSEEKRKYDKVVFVDGNSKLSELEKRIIRQINLP